MSSKSPVFEAERFQVVEVEVDGKSKLKVVHPGAVAIVPMIDENTVCLISNRRFAVEETLIEIPAGTREPDEAPDVTARRELAEETGYRAGSIGKLFDYYVSPGILNEKMHVFVATDLTPGPQSLEPDEQIQCQSVPFETALDWIHNGKIRDAKTIASLLFYDRIRNQRLG